MATWGHHVLALPMSDIEPTVPGFSGSKGPRRPLMWSRSPARGLQWPQTGAGRGWPAWLLVLVLAAVAVGIPTAVLSHDATAYFVFSPGTAPVITTSSGCKLTHGELALPNGMPCVRLVIPKGRAHRINGKLLMVDIELSQASPLDYAEYELGLLGRERQLVPVAAVMGSAPTSEMGCQEGQQMASADQDAAVAALETLRYRVIEQPLGAEMTAVYAGSPAWSAGVRCDDLVTAVDGKAVRDALDFSTLVSSLPPGTVVTLTDRPANNGRTRNLKARLVEPPADLVAEGFASRAYLGVGFETRFRTKLPFPISVDAGDIGGPSAGLAFSLAILDALSNGRLTGGHTVAATGTIDTNGNVGDVGGVQEKTAAVEKAGAQVFFVPKAEYAVARGVAGKHLQVVPVTTLQQVLEILQHRYGGDLEGLAADSKA